MFDSNSLNFLVVILIIGYYTRSGYVPGPVCRYNWTKVWSTVDIADKYLKPKVIITRFS